MKTEKTPSIAGPPEPPLTLQQPPAQVALGSLRNFRLATTLPSQPVSVTVGHRDTSVVDAVLKRFPPPPGPDDRDPDTHSTQMGKSESLDGSRTFESNQPPKSCRPAEQPELQTLRPARASSAAVSADTPAAPGLGPDHRNTHTLPGTEDTLCCYKGGSSFESLQKSSTFHLVLVLLENTMCVFQMRPQKWLLR